MSMATARSIADRVTRYLDTERPTGEAMLDAAVVAAKAVAATEFYRGYAYLESYWVAMDADPETAEQSASIDTDSLITDSEWAIIRPLFLLYIERETAMMLEASRGLGVDVFGRAVSEIAQEITVLEQELAHRAFLAPILTI